MLVYHPSLLVLIATISMSLHITVNSYSQPLANEDKGRVDINSTTDKSFVSGWIYPFQFLHRAHGFNGRERSRYIVATAYLRSVTKKNEYFAIRIPFRHDNLSLNEAKKFKKSLQFGISEGDEQVSLTKEQEITLVNERSKKNVTMYLIGCWKGNTVNAKLKCAAPLSSFENLIENVISNMKNATTAIHRIIFPTFRTQGNSNQATSYCVNELGLNQNGKGSRYHGGYDHLKVKKKYTFNDPFYFVLVNEEEGQVITHEFVDKVVPFTRSFLC